MIIILAFWRLDDVLVLVLEAVDVTHRVCGSHIAWLSVRELEKATHNILMVIIVLFLLPAESKLASLVHARLMVRQRRWCVVLLSADERQFRPRGVLFEHTQVQLRGSRLLVDYS